jgi:hypothetical protein
MFLFRRPLAIGVISVMVAAVLSCEKTPVGNQSASSPASPIQSPSPPQKPESLLLPADTVLLMHMGLTKDSTTPLTGDLRPRWRVQGVIYNKSDHKTVSNVKIRVLFIEVTTGTSIDSDDIDITMSVRPKVMQFFVREVSLRPPGKGVRYEWNYQVVRVEGEP